MFRKGRNWVHPLDGCLDVAISKYGIWIVKADNTVQYRSHGTSSWDTVSSGRPVFILKFALKYVYIT